ncbi:MAG: hypothetical protein J6X16_07075 [Bacteroidales bacterium]|nr:hypothetical protein [Bacteroidales bacterium]
MKKVQLPVSKSLYIRKLIYDFLKYHRLDDIGAGFPEDVRIVHESLRRIQKAETEQNPTNEAVRIDVRDCGAAYRFLMAVLAVTPGQWLLTGTPRLLQRPIDELVQVLREMGAEIQWCSCRDARPCVSTNEYGGCWQIQGKTLHASELTIDCTRSGQFASALWLISDKIGLKKLHVLPENPSSAAYIAMTKSIVESKADLNAKRMGDWSAAVYWYARLLLEGQMYGAQRSQSSSDTVSCDAPVSYKLLHLDLQSLQSDAIIAQWFAQWGIVSRQEEDGVVIEFKDVIDCQKNTLTSDDENTSRKEEIKLDKSADSQGDMIELEMNQNLDLVPVLACMACLWPKKMVFNGVANLKYKESNRLQIIQEQLSSFAIIEIKSYNGIPDNQVVINPICRYGVCPVSDEDGVASRGDVPCRVYTNNDAISHIDAMNCVYTNDVRSNIPPGIFSFNAHNDHRFVMGFSLFALKGKVLIKDFDCVRKSYPDFKAEGVVTGTDMLG